MLRSAQETITESAGRTEIVESEHPAFGDPLHPELEEEGTRSGTRDGTSGAAEDRVPAENRRVKEGRRRFRRDGPDRHHAGIGGRARYDLRITGGDAHGDGADTGDQIGNGRRPADGQQVREDYNVRCGNEVDHRACAADQRRQRGEGYIIFVVILILFFD